MMWFLLLLHSLAHFGPASSSDPKPGKIILRNLQDKDSPCKGHVEAYYGNEKGYVGDKYWNKATEEVVCRSTHCGKPENGIKDVYRPLNSKVWLNELQCQGNERSLWDCEGWPGPEVSFYKKPTVKMVTCSNKIKINLKPHKCEGAVQYTVQSTGQPNRNGYICSNGFGNEEANMLCKNLGCGGVTEILRSEWMHLEDFQNVERMEMNCSGIADVTHPWQCVQSASPSCALPVLIMCKGHDRVQLKGEGSNVCSGLLEKEKDKWKSTGQNRTSSDKLCQQMHCGASGNLTQDDKGHHLTCSDRVSVVLTNDRNSETKCYGRAISYKSLSQDTSGILDHVECTGSESSLWHCRAKHHNNIRCSSVPYVVCSGSVNVKLVDGPGRCAGKLEVQHEDQWKTAISDKWDETFSAVVCKQLECGASGNKSSKTFDKRTGNFLTLSCNNGTQISDISECITDDKGTQVNDQVEITCENHKVIFLEESKPCSGTVGIEYRDKTHWLSGSNQTWNQNVANMICQELHCGNASNFSSKPFKKQTSFLVESRNCSSSNKYLLQCDTEHQEPDNNQTLAYVDCEGSITVTLTHGCWGKVNISTVSKQGYVSKDAWTEAMSVQLCKELACQDKTLPTHKWLEETILTFKSLHALRTASKLSQHTLVDVDTKLRQKPAYVVCKGSVKPRFKPSRDKCSGNVEVFYEGSWIPVHKDALENIDNQNTICEELNCGKAVTRIEYSGPLEVNHFIKRLQCQKNTNSLATCQDVVVEKIERTLQTSDLTGLKCSEWSTMALEVEHSCKGEVVVYSKGVNNQETKRSFVSSQGWAAAEGERLCMDLKCGKYKLIENRIISAEANSLWSQSFDCSSKPESIWQCEKKQTAISQGNKIFLECEDEPKIALSEKCTGKLTINGSPVCSSQWKTDYSHRVCQQLNCSNAIHYWQSSPSSTDSYHVDCDEHNYLIGQCKRVFKNTAVA
ncbi:hypothetical protein CRENBAI_003996 [Crenichthys baileyi]|uniref:SRCR domain-containing protein n=1 Tax=Crenichthys baileyi TaxID=28760 RepID=A0AAV9SJ84_9TELE